MKTKATKKFVHHLLLEVRNQEINEGLLDTVKGFFGGKPKVQEPKVEEPKAEEPKAEEPKAEEPKAEEPKPSAAPEKPETPDEKKARIAYLAQQLEVDSNAQANDAAEMFQVAAGRLAIKPGNKEDDYKSFWAKFREMNDKYGKLFRYVLKEAPAISGMLKMFTAISKLRPNSEEYDEFKSEADEVATLLNKVGITPMTEYSYPETNGKTYPIPPISNFFYAKKFILAASTALPEPSTTGEGKVKDRMGFGMVDVTFNSPGNTIFYALATQSNPLKNVGDKAYLEDFALSWFTNYNETGKGLKAGYSVSDMKADVIPRLDKLSSVKIVENVNYVNVSRLQKLAGILKD